jgi:hypothetical protein
MTVQLIQQSSIRFAADIKARLRDGCQRRIAKF